MKGSAVSMFGHLRSEPFSADELDVFRKKYLEKCRIKRSPDSSQAGKLIPCILYKQYRPIWDLITMGEYLFRCMAGAALNQR